MLPQVSLGAVKLWICSIITLRYISETVQASAKVTIELEYDFIRDLSNGVISDQFEWPYNPGFKVTVLFKGEYLK